MISDIILQPKGVAPGAFSYATDFGMVDFPVMNMHPHAATLNGLIKLLGVEFTPEGMVLTPVIPLPTWRFTSPLLGLARSATGYEGWYDPVGSHNRWTIRLRLPVADIGRLSRLTINRVTSAIRSEAAGEIIIAGDGGAGKRFDWQLTAH